MSARTADMPLWDEPLVWKVEAVVLSAEARKYGAEYATYPFHVRGKNWATSGYPEFCWNVRDLNDPRYDLTSARMDVETATALARKVQS